MSKVLLIGAPLGARDSSSVQLELEDVTVCVVAAWSNSQRTVSPTSIVTFAGWNCEALVSTESITTVAADAGDAAIAHPMATTTASSADRKQRITNGSPPLDSTP